MKALLATVAVLQLVATNEVAHLSPHTYPVAIRMLSEGLLPIDEIVTQRMPLADFQKGIDLVASGATSIKVTLEP